MFSICMALQIAYATPVDTDSDLSLDHDASHELLARKD